MAATPKLKIFTMIAEADPVIAVTDDTTGAHLKCQADHMSNCKHIAKVLSENRDVYIFDLERFEVPLSLPHSIWIPIKVDSDTIAAGTAKRYMIDTSLSFVSPRIAKVLPDRNLGLLLK